MTDYYDHVNKPLLDCINSASTNIIEFGCANGRLGEEFKKAHTAAKWTGIDNNIDALHKAAYRLDNVIMMDLNRPRNNWLRSDYDGVVMGNILEYVINPEKLLTLAHNITDANAKLYCTVTNSCHISLIERMLAGDLSYNEYGVIDKSHTRMFSSSSLFKMLLDCGWLPTTLGNLYASGSEPFTNTLLNAGSILGLPREFVAKNISNLEFVIDAKKFNYTLVDKRASFSVVIPVTDERQLELNINRSPGLLEIEDMEIILVHGAKSAGEAFEQGRKQATREWVVFCHQDVYFPKGSGILLSNKLAQFDAEKTIVGFAGLDNKRLPAGLVVDRDSLFDCAETTTASSMDEFAVVIGRNNAATIDPIFGWHLWATDLCMLNSASIVRVPLFHNSTNTSVGNTTEVNQSIIRLQQKHKGFGKIYTFSGIVEC